MEFKTRKRLENTPKTQRRMFKRGRDGEDSETWSKSPRARPSLSPAMRGMAGDKIIPGKEQSRGRHRGEREREIFLWAIYLILFSKVKRKKREWEWE
jgi:hypothetical protein